LMCSAGRQ